MSKQMSLSAWAAFARVKEPVLHLQRLLLLWTVDSHQLHCLKRTCQINQRAKQQVRLGLFVSRGCLLSIGHFRVAFNLITETTLDAKLGNACELMRALVSWRQSECRSFDYHALVVIKIGTEEISSRAHLSWSPQERMRVSGRTRTRV